MIDIEKLLTEYLKDETEHRIVGEVPASTGTAWVKVVLLDTDDRTRPTDYLLRYFVQLDCYAGKDGGQGEAQGVAADVRAAIMDLPQADVDATVTCVIMRGPRRVPDTAFETARQRYVLEAELYVSEAEPNVHS